jgi:Co/Zn/Cd efflux system component
MLTFGTPNELALVAFLIGVVIIHSIVPKIGEAVGRLFERDKRKSDS